MVSERATCTVHTENMWCIIISQAAVRAHNFTTIPQHHPRARAQSFVQHHSHPYVFAGNRTPPYIYRKLISVLVRVYVRRDEVCVAKDTTADWRRKFTHKGFEEWFTTQERPRKFTDLSPTTTLYVFNAVVTQQRIDILRSYNNNFNMHLMHAYTILAIDIIQWQGT